LTSRGWVDPVPDPLLLRKSGSAGDRTRDLCICSQKLWPLDQWVASTLHTTSEHGVTSITTADAHNSAASSRLKRRPRRFKWTRPFRRKTKSGFCACAITFHTQSTHQWGQFMFHISRKKIIAFSKQFLRLCMTSNCNVFRLKHNSSRF